MDGSNHGLSFYLNKINTEGQQVHSLLDKLREVIDTVEPDSGYARTLLDMSNRMLNSNKLLLAEVDGKTAAASTKVASLYMDPVLMGSFHKRQAYHNFF